MSKKIIISNLLIVRSRQFAILGSAALMMLPGIVQAQLGGGGVFSGSVPASFSITDNLGTNATLSGTLGTFGNLAIGSSSTLVTSTTTSTPLTFRLRSNAAYQLSASVTSLTGMTDLASTGVSTTAQDIHTGDIGFGIMAIGNTSGASVVSGRTDTPTTGGYDLTTAGWSTATAANGHTPSFLKTLNSLGGSTGVEILKGDRISASGDNTSPDNFITVTLGVATLPQFFTPTASGFTATVTLTIASQ